MKRLKLSEDYWLDIEVASAGIPGHQTLSLYATFPLAQHPRAQRITQITGTAAEIWEIGTAIHAAVSKAPITQ